MATLTHNSKYSEQHTMIEKFKFVFHNISDHGDVLISKAINYIGFASVGAGGANYVANQSDEMIEAGFVMPDWGLAITMAGGIVFIIKNLADIYFSWRKHKRDENI